MLVVSLGYAAVPASAATTSGSPQPPAVDGHDVFQQTSNNSTVVHEDPDGVQATGSQSDIRRWLERRMSEVVIDCTVDGGDSEACAALDREYPEWASQYVELRGDTDAVSAQNTNRTLRETRHDVQQFNSQVATFRRLEDDYEEAVANGNEERQLELAHRLVEQGRRINRTQTDLQRDYSLLANTTDTDMSPAAETVARIEANTTATTESVREAELLATELDVTVSESSGSFVSPMVIEGRLQRTDSVPMSLDQATFQVGNDTVTTALDGNGRFSFQYRPKAQRTGSQDITVAYRPDATSLYDRSTDSALVDIQGTEGSISVEHQPDTVRFGETVRVTGRIEAQDRGASDVPVAVTLGDVRIGTARTDRNGAYSLNATVPANVSAGETAIESGLPFSGRAFSAPNATTTIGIMSTETTITITGNRTGTSVARISGELRTDRGPVAGRTVTLSANGSTLGRVRTDQNGRFSTTVALPASVTDTDSTVVVATYSGTDESLESSRARARLDSLTTGSPGTVEQMFGRLGKSGSVTADYVRSVPRIFALPVGLLGLLLLGRLLSRQYVSLPNPTRIPRVSWLRAQFQGDESTQAGEDNPAVEPGPETFDEPSEPPIDLLAEARESLASSETDDAVIISYEAVRGQLVDRLGGDPSMTHWELVRSYGARQAGDRIDALQRLTGAYERAAFSSERTSEETTRLALETADSLLEELDKRGDSAGD